MLLPIFGLLAAVASPQQQRMASLMQCLADAAERLAPSAEPAETIADAVMGECSSELGAVEEAERRGVYGAQAEQRMADVQRDGRAVLRQRVLARVLELRANR
jgi:hypothetical protein